MEAHLQANALNKSRTLIDEAYYLDKLISAELKPAKEKLVDDDEESISFGFRHEFDRMEKHKLYFKVEFDQPDQISICYGASNYDKLQLRIDPESFEKLFYLQDGDKVVRTSFDDV